MNSQIKGVIRTRNRAKDRKVKGINKIKEDPKEIKQEVTLKDLVTHNKMEIVREMIQDRIVEIQVKEVKILARVVETQARKMETQAKKVKIKVTKEV